MRSQWATALVNDKMVFSVDRPFFVIRRMILKPSKDDSEFAVNRSVEEIKPLNEDGMKNTALSLSGKDPEQHHRDLEVMVNEEDALKDLIGMGRKLAHQLNNQLTTILANTQLVCLMLESEELGPYLKAVEDATRDAAETVGSFQESVRALAQIFPQD